METMDNPSYFSLPGARAASLRAAGGRLLRIMGATSSSSSVGSGGRGHSAPTTPIAETSTPLSTPLRSSSTINSSSRRSFRSLLPSISGGGNHNMRSDVRQLVLGHPRVPADTAPSVSGAASPIRKDTPQQGESELADDMVYYNLPAPPLPRPSESSSVVSSSKGAESPGGVSRYYNVCAGGRRHSIGTFVGKERVKAAAAVAAAAARTTGGERGNVTWGSRRKSGREAEPWMKEWTSGGFASNGRSLFCGDVASTSRTTSTPEHMSGAAEWRHHARKRCHRCSNKTSAKGNADLDDILVISSRQSQVAALWVSYLKSCFDQISKLRNRPPFKLLSVCLEDFGPTIPVALEEKMAGVRLQVVIICPQFLDYLFQHPEPGSAVGRLLCPERVLAMLLGVEENSINEEHRAALISYNQWKHLQVKNKDEKFVADFLNVAMGILSRVSTNTATRSEKALFSVMPKKVKEGQSKVIILLTEPLEKEDEITVKVEKTGEILEVTQVKKRNPYTLHFSMPVSCLEISMLVGVHVLKNGKPLGCRQVKCESRMRELDQILRSSDNPLDFMCQTLGFSPGDRDQLDNFLLAAFQRNLPPHFNLLSAVTSGHTQHRPYSSSEEYPTLLHFAARFGLEKLAWQLLECPGGEHACDIRNVCELTPAEMAEKAGHSKLANSLKGYLQMSEFSSMYSYLKMVCQNQNNTAENLREADYHKPRPLSETYQVPPSARPLPTPTPTAPTTPTDVTESPSVLNGYMEMHPAGNSSSPLMETTSENLNLSFIEQASVPLEDEAHQRLQKNASKKSREQLFESVQDELAEIINDFKNNVFTIAEVEKLVDNWKNRNDVQQSFKDKQEQLDKMRTEYERIQKKMKDDMKRPTPFERIRKFFKGKGKDGKDASSSKSNQKSQNSDSLSIRQRPSSSLSLQSLTSSSSSERMSLASGCSGASLGDSGTHSDPEDRKPSSGAIAGENNALSAGNELASASQVYKATKPKTIRSYEVPPKPRPVQGNHGLNFPPNSFSTPLNTANPSVTSTLASSPDTMENRPPLPVPRVLPSDCSSPNGSEDSHYYITPNKNDVSFSLKLSETSIEGADYTNIEVPQSKTPRSKEKCELSLSFSSAISCSEGERYLNLVVEREFNGTHEKSLSCSEDCNSPKTPSSPVYLNSRNEVEFPNYANVTSAAIPILQNAGQAFSTSIPPPVPPRLE